MTAEDSRPDPLSLLDPTALADLLQAFEARPGQQLALFTSRGTLVAGRADWPEAAVHAMQRELTDGTEDDSDSGFEALPLQVRGETAGVLLAAAGVARRVLDPLRQALTVLLGQALELRDAADEQLAERRQADLFYRLGETIGATLDLDQIAGPLTVVAQRATGAEAAVLLLHPTDEAGGELVLQASVGEPQRVAELVAAASAAARRSAFGGDGAGRPTDEPPTGGPVLTGGICRPAAGRAGAGSTCGRRTVRFTRGAASVRAGRRGGHREGALPPARAPAPAAGA